MITQSPKRRRSKNKPGLPLVLPTNISPDQHERIVAILRERQDHPNPRPPLIFGYVRVSREDYRTEKGPDGEKKRIALGLSPDEQVEAINVRRDLIRQKHPEAEIGKVYQDINVSAIKKPLDCRLEGIKLLAALRPGDHVVFKRLDRGFRNAADLFRWMEDFAKRGITLHFTDLPPDVMTSPAGKLMVAVQGVFAQYEGELACDRNQAIADHRRRRMPECRVLPNCKGGGIGYKKRGGKGRRYHVEDKEQRRWLGFIRHLREFRDPPLSYPEIGRVLNAYLCAMPPEEAGGVKGWRDRRWPPATVKDWYDRAILLGVEPRERP